MGELTAQAETIHRETPVVFYCRVGGRSAMAANAFRRAGYDAYTMTGGLVEWEAQGCRSSPTMGTWRITDRPPAAAPARGAGKLARAALLLALAAAAPAQAAPSLV